MRITKKDRELIFQKYGGKCAFCGCELQKGWHADHLKPIDRFSELVRDENYNVKRVVKIGRPENDVLENMNPACASCNINKHNLTVEGFRNLINGFLNSLNQRSTQYKFAKKYGLIQETDKPVIFYFEKAGKQ
jgi:5-methylcytosine-specific restriction endonuclease McrA